MEELLQIIDARIKKNTPITITIGKAVNVRDGLCDIKRDDAPDLYDVRFYAAEFDDSDYLSIKPKEGSYVLIGVIDNEESEAVVLAYSRVDKIELHGNDYGGLLISQKVVDEINQIKQDLNTLKTAFNSWVVAPGDGGAALKAIAASWSTNNLSPAIATDLENKNVKHG